ncbi:hypothetical protein M23134_03418 [Microscilla marina ATCC 23134]|uniref:Uncharacterized protein n=1 Tax=Microscilla marina ATCC 23134 TaxID=313606 RepID=A1ZMX6_MICM2|nr:hypothetical protein M23134_03418 [Microscilla marina ATCC 23134]
MIVFRTPKLSQLIENQNIMAMVFIINKNSWFYIATLFFIIKFRLD